MALLNYTQQGSGPHVILIHGLFGSLENLNMVAKKLRDNYTVTSVDVRNHGSSFHENSMSYEELAQDIINVMDHLNIESADFSRSFNGWKNSDVLCFSFSRKN